MSKLKELSEALSETLSHEDLHSLSIDIAETVIDSLMDEGVVRAIPILGTAYKLGRLGSNIRDRLFLKKIVYFLAGIENVPADERARMIAGIDDSGEYQVRVGEKLLYILDKSEDHENARIIAFLFSAFLSGELTYEDFLRTSRSVQNVLADDLWYFVDNDDNTWTIEEAGDLLSAGLFGLEEINVNVVRNWDTESEEKYRIEGGNPKALITPVGQQVRSILGSRGRK